MSEKSPLLKEYERLCESTDAQKRGYDLQALVARILGGYHFKVETKPGAARPRQVDLFATRGDTIYLIETKWRKDKANIDDIDALYVRLEAVPANVMGLLVSHAGFTEQVLERVREKSFRPVILVSGNEIEKSLRWDGDFFGSLRLKANALLVHREVLVDQDARSSRRRTSTSASRSDLPAGNRLFVWKDGTRLPWLQCKGSFDRFTFVPELQDIDWSIGVGVGVTLDVRLPIQEQKELVGLLDQMARMGWVTRKGCWSIQQSTAIWHGFGAMALVDVLDGWKKRYEGLETHHTEEVCYVDECEDGFYTLVAQISADKRRIVWQVEISFQLRGIPLDTSPYRELCDHFGLSDPVYFRPRSARSREWGRPTGAAKLRTVTPLAYIVEVGGLMGDDDAEWAAGIVVENPFFGASRKTKPKWVPDLVERSELLVCALRSWHELGNPKSAYELWEFESAWTSDALVVRALTDWPNEPSDDVPAITFMGEEAPKSKRKSSRKQPEAPRPKAASGD